ncbi:hypothetical protein Tco_0770338 [Tanacetum coccineum]|uniref:Uncharacterized protein n=1 Tax=Tanacetum coccineum TaxID=301880 RepID=A0ABQ4ZFI0_9ASTR
MIERGGISVVKGRLSLRDALTDVRHSIMMLEKDFVAVQIVSLLQESMRGEYLNTLNAQLQSTCISLVLLTSIASSLTKSSSSKGDVLDGGGVFNNVTFKISLTSPVDVSTALH